MRNRRRVRLRAVLSVAALAGVGSVAAAAADADAPLLFAGSDPLEISASHARTGSRIEIRNNTDAVVTDVRVAPSAVVQEDSESGDRLAVATLEVTPPAEPIKPGESGFVAFRLTFLPLPGRYRTSIAVWPKGGGELARRELVITAGPGEPMEAKPRVEELTLTIYRRDIRWEWLPWSGRFDGRADVELPLAVEDGEAIKPAPRRLGALAGPSVVAVEAGTVPDSGSSAMLPVRLVGLEQGGSYEGKLDLVPDDPEAGNLSLTLIYKDAIYLPLLTVLAGVAVGWALTRALKVSVPLNAMLSAVRARLSRAATLQRTFKKQAKNTPGRDWSIDAAAKAEADALALSIAAARRSYAAVPDDQLAAMQSRLESFDSRLTEFEGLAGKLRDLSTARSRVEALRPQLPLVGAPERPDFVNELERGLRDQKLQTIADVTVVSGKLEAALLTMQTAVERLQRLKRIQARIARVEQERPNLDVVSLQTRLNRVARQVWEYTPAQMADPAAEEPIDTLGNDVATIESGAGIATPDGEEAHALPPPGDAAPRPRAPGGWSPVWLLTLIAFTVIVLAVLALSSDVSAVEPPGIAVPDWAILTAVALAVFGILALACRRIPVLRKNSLIVLLFAVAFVVAAASGLKELYVGQPFGTSGDYVGLFLGDWHPAGRGRCGCGARCAQPSSPSTRLDRRRRSARDVGRFG